MLQLDRNNAAFDETMEVLCLLTKRPIGVPISEIAQDMGFDKSGDVRAILKKIHDDHGIKVETWTDQNCHVVGIHSSDWQKLQDIGKAYLQTLERKSIPEKPAHRSSKAAAKASAVAS